MPPTLPPTAATGLTRLLGRRLANASITAPAAPCRACCPRISRPRSIAGIHTTSPAAAAAAAQSYTQAAQTYIPPTQPPSAKLPDIRKTQLLRTYTSLIRSTPLLLVFQHSNLTAPEWAAIRRELSLALNRTAEEEKLKGVEWPEDLTAQVRLQVVRTRMFNVALKVTEFYNPETDPTADGYTHDLSKAARDAVNKAIDEGVAADPASGYAQLSPLLVGPVALLTFPAVSPVHLAAALSVLAPSPPDFPMPSRKKSPGYYEMDVQGALQKLLLVGGRVEGKAFDREGLQWVGSIGGGRAGLQAQLVSMLQSAGMGLTTALEGASKSLWLTMESHRSVLEEGEKPKEES